MAFKDLNSIKLLVRALLRPYGETRMGPARDRWLGALCFRLAERESTWLAKTQKHVRIAKWRFREVPRSAHTVSQI